MSQTFAVEEAEAVEAFFENGWTDGLPVVPPTAERVDAMLAGGGVEPDETLGTVPHLRRSVTAEKAAVNAVLAGCKPEYFPIVLAGVGALLDPAFNANAVLTSTGGAALCLVVSGPRGIEIGMNARFGALGCGNRANATIGRALRLIAINVLGVKHGSLDASSLGHPGKYSLCFAEDDPPAPWEPLRVELGYTRDDTTVTLLPTEGPRQIANLLNEDPEGVLRTYVSMMRVPATFIVGKGGQALVVMGPEHALAVRAGGWSKADVREFFLRESRVFPEELEAAGVLVEHGSQHEMIPGDDGKLATFGSADDIFVVTAGGEGAGWSSYIPTWAPKLHSVSVTRRVRAAGEALPDCGPDACEVVLQPIGSPEERSAT